jgi:hypothetical protein
VRGLMRRLPQCTQIGRAVQGAWAQF